jgi:hypothetical protein
MKKQKFDNQPNVADATNVDAITIEAAAKEAAAKEAAAKKFIVLRDKAIVRLETNERFAEKVFLKEFFEQMAKLEQSTNVRAGIMGTNLNYLNNPQSCGYNFVYIPSTLKFTPIFEATETGLKELKDWIEANKFKGTRLLVYTKAKKAHIVGSIKDFTNIPQIFTSFDSVKEITFASRLHMPSGVSIGTAIKLANQSKLSYLTGNATAQKL